MNATQSQSESEPRSTPLLEVDGVDAHYGKARALSDVSLSLEAGDVQAVVGPNGAGKTTLMDCITGFMEFEGTITFDGESVAEMEPWEVSADIGYSTEAGNLFTDMSVRQNLELGGYVDQDAIEKNLQEVFEIFPRLEDRQEQRARTLSGGEQQMLSIGRSLMTDPELLILDEPSLGLAPTIIKDISAAMDTIHDRGVTILIAEQNVQIAFQHADTICLIENGAIERRGTPAELEADEDVRETYFGE